MSVDLTPDELGFKRTQVNYVQACSLMGVQVPSTMKLLKS